MTEITEPPNPEPTPTPTWRKALVWVERLVLAGLLVFVAIRLGPQLGALTGVGPTLGSAPAFTAVTLDGDTLDSRQLEGRVVVVNFWATWCLPCRLEMPSLQKLHQRRKDDGVLVLGLATDVGSAAPIREFLSEHGISYPVARATSAQRRAFGGISGIPTTFLIDREGVVRHRVVGYFAPPAMNAAVSRLVEEAVADDG